MKAYRGFYRTHLTSRLSLGLAMVALLLAGRTATVLLVGLLAVASIDGGWVNLIRAFRILRWFIVPILLLHLLLTGGERVWPELGLPLSLDGLKAGVLLSLRLAAFYILAMFVSRLLLRHEVASLLLAIPHIGERAYPYLLSLQVIRTRVRSSISRFRKQFGMRRHWWQTGVMLNALFHHMYVASKDSARQLWLRWPETMNPAVERRWRWYQELPLILAAACLFAIACLP